MSKKSYSNTLENVVNFRSRKDLMNRKNICFSVAKTINSDVDETIIKQPICFAYVVDACNKIKKEFEMEERFSDQ